ncbi:MAG: DNA-binding transcriptional ArsR family regulator/protein-L-isoaspartate O-methyltransferase [Kiritimatiellia bacterium]|jgi:DNA-binding transcriptional ArsR family regulator/protein-L-isoaspartate O-methyltransferase
MDLDSTTELLRVLAEPTRVRLLRLLFNEELTVAELVRATGLAQPRVSTHLRRLREAGLVRDERRGAHAFYGLPDQPWPDDTMALWRALSDAANDPLLDADQAALAEVLSARHQGKASWADTVAGQMARHYSPGRTWQALCRGLVGLTQLGQVLDVASGDGATAELLAPRAESVTCVDLSPRVVAAGRRRLGHLGNVRFVHGDMHDLPMADCSVQHVMLMTSLCYATDPAKALFEAHRVLAVGGQLVGVVLRAHPHREQVARYDHVQNGFEHTRLRGLLEQVGFQIDLCAPTARERRAPHFQTLTLHARRIA